MLLILCAILFNFIYSTLVEILSRFVCDTLLPGVVKVVKKLLGIKEDPRKILQNDLRRVISRILNKHSNIVLVEGHLHLCPCDECFKVFDGITDWSAIMRAVDLDGVEAAIDWEAVHAATDYESLVPQ